MLPSMPFLSTNSETSLPLPESANESHTKLGTNEKESPDNGKDNSVSKKVLDEKNRINNKTNASISSTRQKLPSKAQRELEANKAMFLNSDPSTDEIKDTNYAMAFFEKVKSRFNSNKFNSKFETFQSILNTFNPQYETPCELYNKLTELFGSENADLTEEFLTFLTPGQATEIGRFSDYFMLTCMADFIERLQIFFSSKPAQLRKILWCLESLAEKPENELTIDCIKISILPLLKGNQYLMDWFLKLFPEEKPPDSLMNNGYEVIDLERSNDLDEPSGIASNYEMINIPSINENYGNNNCICACHNITDEKFKKRLRHCLACGTKYIQGRMYAQHGKGLRTVFLNWHTNSEIDQTRRLSSSSSPRQGNPRKRTASIDPQNPSLLSKADSDDERVSPKRNAKFLKTPTSKGKRSLALSKNLSKNNENSEVNITQSKNCSKNILKDDENIGTGSKANADSHKNDILAVSLQNNNEDMDFEVTNEFTDFKRRFKENELVTGTSTPDVTENNDICVENPQDEIRNSVNPELTNSTDTESKKNICSELQENVPTKVENPVSNWTREEDKTILLMMREEIDSQSTINKIHELLPHRKLDEITERFENVLNLLQKLT